MSTRSETMVLVHKRTREAQRQPGHLTTIEASAETGLSLRQLDYLDRTGRFTATGSGCGSGRRRWWSPEAVDALCLISARLDWGMELWAAIRSDDPPLPEPPVT